MIIQDSVKAFQAHAKGILFFILPDLCSTPNAKDAKVASRLFYWLLLHAVLLSENICPLNQ
jgi:hypothetical protein